MAEENELLRRYAESGDQDAFGQFVARRSGFVYARALPRLGGDEHAARDACQLVFVAVARNAAALATHPQLSGWLFTATRNACSTWVRSERRRKRREFEAIATYPPEAPAADSEGQPDVEGLLDLLGERERAAVILRYFDNLSYAAIGGTLRISEEAARKCIERAVASLRRHLTRRGQVTTALSIGAFLAANRAQALPPETSQHFARSALLSSKALSAPSTSLVLHAMAHSKLLAGALGITALAFVAAGYRNKAETQRLTLEPDSTQGRIPPRSTAPTRTAVSPVVPKAKKPGISAAEAPDDVRAAAASGRALILERSRLARTDPECEALMAKMVSGALHDEYGHFYQLAGLSKEQEKAVENAVLEDDLQQTDIAASAAAHRTPTSDPAIQALLDQSKATLRSDLVGALGDANYQAFVDYQANVAQRDFVETVSGELWQARQPMSTDQFRQVLDAVESSTSASGIAITDTHWTQLQTRVEALLTPAQMPTWNAVVVEQKYSAAVVRQMNQH